jgi:trehalose synthase
MYGTLALTPKALDDYRAIAGDAIDEIRQLARPLAGLRVLHLSATAFGTGVAELLNAAVPLLSDAGLTCDWQVVRPTEESAAANKALYRALAGAEADWSADLGETWLRYSAMNAELMTDGFDVVVVHDPQPAAIRSFVAERARRAARWVFHSHLDLSSADPDAWTLLRSHIEGYDAIVFDADGWTHPDLKLSPITIIRPAIDPLGPRNMPLDAGTVQTLMCRYGLDPARPIISQMSPCDPGCDLLGMIDLHDRVRGQVPGLQLVLIAANPPEGPAGISYFNDVVRKSMEYSDVHILRGVSEGLRKGFGLWISDAQWKERPVVTARQGELAAQVIDGETGFLAGDTDEFAARVVDLLRDPALAARLGRAGHEHVKAHFLITRFLTDELRLLTALTRERR